MNYALWTKESLWRKKYIIKVLKIKENDMKVVLQRVANAKVEIDGKGQGEKGKKKKSSKKKK